VLAFTVACDREEHNETEPAAADNTRKNKGDEQASAVTPTDQAGNKADLDLTQKIRQDIMSADTLSFTAKNAKVMTQGGKVTLRGAVETQNERAAIDSIAKTAGAQSVDNQLEVKQ